MAITLKPDTVKLVQALIEVAEGEFGKTIESVTVDTNPMYVELRLKDIGSNLMEYGDFRVHRLFP